MPPHRNNAVKTSALNMFRAGNSTTKISLELNVPVRTLQTWISAARKLGTLTEPGSAVPAPRKVRSDAGIGRKVSPLMLRAVKRKLLNNRFLTANDLRERVPGLESITKQHLNRVIRDKIGLQSCAASKKPLLTDAQRVRRVAWAKSHRRWSTKKWNSVLWSDESHVEIFLGGFNSRVRRYKGENRYLPNLCRPTVKHPAKLMAWGCMGNGKLGRLVILPHNVKMDSSLYQEVLNKNLRSSMTMTGTDIFMQDGAPCHTSRKMKAWFDVKGLEVLDWPGQSPDQNPIENLWREWKRIMATKLKPPKNLDQLAHNMRVSWLILGRKKALLKKLCDSPRRRIEALLELDGGTTKY